jgi:signal peptidase I
VLSEPQSEPQEPAVTGERFSDQPSRTDWWGEFKGIFWLVLAVLGFHSLVAKPFYIPSESMMPTLIKGDRLIVSKYPYGWSYASISFYLLPEMPGRILGQLPKQGDVIIVAPRGQQVDYIKRVIGLPGDRIAVRGGTVYLNGTPVKREPIAPAQIPIDANIPCTGPQLEGRAQLAADGTAYCVMPRVRETLPNGVSYDTIDLGYNPAVDDYPELTVPAGQVFVMGDNRDQSADSRVSAFEKGLDGPLPLENIGGRAEFITFSLDGSSHWWNPLSWFTGLRSTRAFSSLRPDTAEDAQ